MEFKDLNTVRIILTTLCNIECTYCYMTDMCIKKETISEDLLNRIVDYIEKNMPEGIKITFFGGEPLMLFDMIMRVIERYPSLDYGMSSNGLLFDEAKLNFFKKYKHSAMIQFSLDGEEDMQMEHRGFLPDYDLMKRAFSEIRSKARMVCVDPKDMLRGLRFIANLGAKEISIGIPIFRKNIDGYKEAYIKQFDIAQKEFQGIKIVGDKLNSDEVCHANNGHMAFSPTGDIYPCDMFYYRGLFKIGSIDEGIDQAKMKEFNDHMKSIFDPDVPCLAHKFYMKDKWINE